VCGVGASTTTYTKDCPHQREVSVAIPETYHVKTAMHNIAIGTALICVGRLSAYFCVLLTPVKCVRAIAIPQLHSNGSMHMHWSAVIRTPGTQANKNNSTDRTRAYKRFLSHCPASISFKTSVASLELRAVKTCTQNFTMFSS